jgi:hypothetical protein
MRWGRFRVINSIQSETHRLVIRVIRGHELSNEWRAGNGSGNQTSANERSQSPATVQNTSFAPNGLPFLRNESKFQEEPRDKRVR